MHVCVPACLTSGSCCRRRAACWLAGTLGSAAAHQAARVGMVRCHSQTAASRWISRQAPQPHLALHRREGPTAARYTKPTAAAEIWLAPASMIT